MTVVVIRTTSRDDSPAHTGLCTDGQMPARIPLIRRISRRKLELPVCNGTATCNLVLQARAIGTETGRDEVLTPDLELVVEEFVGYVAAICVCCGGSWGTRRSWGGLSGCGGGRGHPEAGDPR